MSVSTQPHSEVEIIEDCIQRVDRMKAAVLELLVNLPALQARSMMEETELQRRQLFAEAARR